MKDARNAPQTNVRMPPALKALIREKADRNYRSLNDEILFLIEKGMEAVYGGKQKEAA